MPYTPTHHHRRTIRLQGYDYSQSGMYFVTICCKDKICRFGKIENGEMMLNNFGEIAYNQWVKLSERYDNVLLDVFQIMPNHIHGIIVLNDVETTDKNTNTIAANHASAVGAGLAPALVEQPHAQTENMNIANYVVGATRAGASPAPTRDTLGNIIGAYKSLVANQCLEIFKSKNEYMNKLWQRNYWERIIRNDNSYQYIANYIINNPENWENDKFFTE